jgi:UDP-N-acetylmuramoyl-tripeptide--D-alanyl-D-alanine ligase
MISFSVSEVAEILGAGFINGDAEFDRVSSDTRTLEGAALFVAIPGEHFDGHDYVAAAAEKGAVAALVDHEVDINLPQIVCTNVVGAFGELALAWRRRSSAHVVALTGSNGKTTVKEMLARIFSEMGPVLATRGNLNNNIGVPLTLTRLQEERYAVIEMGANHAGEIHDLSMMTRPDVALLNNAGRAHLEGFGTEEGVARAKAEILYGLKKDGVFVCHGDSKWLPLWKKLAASHRMVTFGEASHCDVRVLDARAAVIETAPDVFEKVRIMMLTDAIPNDTMSFSPDFPDELRGQILDALVEFTASEACLDSICSDQFYSWTGLDPIEDSAYDPVRKLITILGYTEEDIFGG